MTNDLTKGPVAGPLVKFTIPLILGNLFQLTYNAADSIMVGQFVGKNALAAVGAAAPVMNILTFLVAGGCLGAGVLMSEYFGAGDLATLRREVGTTLTAGLGFTVALSALCALGAPWLLRLTQVPPELLGLCTTYLRVVCAALSFTFLYNLYAAALRAVGDSRTPLLFLIISCCLNVCANYVLIVLMGLGVLGAALGTALAEGVSAVLCMVYVWLKNPVLHLGSRDLRPRRALLGRTLRYSWATAMQQVSLYVGKLLVQSCVNRLGVDVIAAFNAVNRIDDFAYTPMQNIAHAMTTFIAQNRGAGKYGRIRASFRVACRLEVGYWAILAAGVPLCSRRLMALFVDEQDVIAVGASYLVLMGLFYVLPAFTNWIQGYFRGMGNMRITVVSTTVQMVFRVLFTFLLAPRFGLPGIAFAQLGGWVAMMIYEVPFLLRALREVRKMEAA